MSQDTTNGSVPFYLPIGDEVDIFRAAYECRLPVLLKGPTGCGKTRFVEHMAHTLRSDRDEDIPENIVTVACHEDLTGSDLVGRYLIKGDDTVWVDGPLTQAVRTGAICYLDEIVEARKDTIVLIHPLTDHRRILPIDKKTEILKAHENFLLVISYIPLPPPLVPRKAPILPIPGGAEREVMTRASNLRGDPPLSPMSGQHEQINNCSGVSVIW